MKAFQKLDSEKAGRLSLSNIYVESVPDKLPEKEILEFPEGGLNGWLTVAGSCVKDYLYRMMAEQPLPTGCWSSFVVSGRCSPHLQDICHSFSQLHQFVRRLSGLLCPQVSHKL